MNNPSDIPNSKSLPPGRYGNLLVLPPTGPGNATDEELTWPIVEAQPSASIRFFKGQPQVGNPSDEELSWPVVDSDSKSESRPMPVADATTRYKPVLWWDHPITCDFGSTISTTVAPPRGYYESQLQRELNAILTLLAPMSLASQHIQILSDILEGKTNEEIAEHRHIAQKSIERLVGDVRRILHARTDELLTVRSIEPTH